MMTMPMRSTMMACRRFVILVASGALLFAAPAFAQSRNDGPREPSSNSNPDTPNTPPKDDPKDRDPRPPSSDGSSVGLPDAVTVLDILRRLPKWPPRGDSSDEDDKSPPDRTDLPDRPVPQNDPQTSDTSDDPPPRRRVVVIPPGQRFTPTPTPRPQGSAPAIVGAITPQARDREVLVTLQAGSDANTVNELSQAFGLDGQTLYTSSLLGVRVVRFRIPDARSTADVLQQLSGDARVETVQPNNEFIASQGAARPLPVPQYAPDKLQLSEAHKIARGVRVKVAIIDTAMDTRHPALAGAVSDTFDALGETKPEPELHGTAIAGIVGAREALTSVAPASNMLAVRAFATTGTGAARSHTMALLKAMDWSVASGARVINMSFAGPLDPLLGQAIDAAVAQGIVVIAAAGNGGPSAKPAYPGAHPKVIAVTATDTSDALFAQSNRGDYIAVAAPGVDIIAAAPNGAYDISSGTSMAAAHVSGVAALMLERDPKLSPDDIRKRLKESARKVGRTTSNEMGAGIVDAAAALEN
ncbi:MAG: peptidase S8 [Hyphomicrobium sp.]|nr:MAG: peptidase S8 [Hyphomicrobium sp.]PPC98627.1 MAG: peptidase S8 [Hyphomicrobium sp.]